MEALLIKDGLRVLIKDSNNIILAGHNKLVKDFYMNFELVGEDMFKAVYTKDFLEGILKIEDENFEKDCRSLLQFWVELFTKELLSANLARRSANGLKNLTYLYELEAKQYMIRLFKEYLK